MRGEVNRVFFDTNVIVYAHDNSSPEKRDKARKLLADTDKTISDIAEECGFYDQSHFIKMFARLRRQTPSEYRRRHRKQTEAYQKLSPFP